MDNHHHRDPTLDLDLVVLREQDCFEVVLGFVEMVVSGLVVVEEVGVEEEVLPEQSSSQVNLIFLKVLPINFYNIL